jgi:hypothetical protein
MHFARLLNEIKSMEVNQMKKLILFGITLIVLSCTGQVRNLSHLERGMMMSNNLYNDIAPQVTSALQSPSTDSTRFERLKLISQRLDEYRRSYDECLKVVSLWKNTGRAPEGTTGLYEEMWKSLIDAQTLAASVYIYASECAARTAIKGKAGNCL